MFKILRNVKACWISMLSIAKRIFVEYKSLIVHMFDEQATNTLAKTNLNLLCNVKIFLGLTCILTLLECMQSLSNFVQA